MRRLIKLLILATVLALGKCLEDFESATAFESAEESNREPLSLDYVEGSFPSYTTKQSLPPSAPAENPFGTSDLFQHHFGNFFEFNPFQNGAFGGLGNFGFDSLQGFNFDSFKPWHKGPNVCTERAESTEDSSAKQQQKREDDDSSSEVETIAEKEPSFVHHFSLNVESCQETSNKHICKRITSQQGQKKTVTITKQCCHGFARQPPSGFCEKVELHTLEEISKTLNTASFIEVAESNGLKDVMQTQNITLFMPSDESFKAYTQDSLNEADGGAMKELLLNHVVKGLFDIEDIDNEDILQTEHENHTIRLNVFPKIRSRRGNDEYKYLYTANCVPIMKANMRSTNGIVHKTQRVLKPVSKSLMDIIRNRDDMTVLRTVLEKTQMDKKLDGTVGGKDFTIFAPNDAAFEKLDAQFKRKIKEGGSCAEKIMENHILQLTFCSAAVIDDDSRVSAYNILGERMTLERSSTENDENTTDNEINTTNESPMNILINGKSRMVEADYMATNGVLHVVDEVLITETALPATTMFGHQNLTIFKKLIEYGGFSNDFDNLENVTYFVPNDEAFEKSEHGKFWMQMLDEAPQKLKNNEKLKKFLEYHVADQMIKTRDLKDEMLTTIGSDRELRVNLYSTMPSFANIMNRATINCARLIHFDQETCGSVVHQVDSTLTAPEMSLLEMLRSTPHYSQFYKMVMKANLSSLLEESSGFTVLVPRDDTFSELSDWIKEKKEAGELDDLIRNHIVPDVKCCAGIVRSQWPFINSFKTISNNYLSTNRDRRPKIQNAAVTKCDVTAKNGIIHEINDIINVEVPRREPANNSYGFNNFFNRPFFFRK